MTARPFLPPGPHACGDACPHPWAAAVLGVPVRPTVHLDVPALTPITWMSYARDGFAYGYPAALMTVEEHVVVGHEIGGGAWLVRFPECGNWAVVHPAAPLTAPVDALAPVAWLAGGPSAHPPPWPLWGGWSGAPGIVHRPPEPPAPLPEAAVPLPATVALMVLGIAALMMKRKAR